MQTQKNSSKTLLYISLFFFAVPILIFGSTILGIDQSGLSTVVYFFIFGLPSILIGSVLAILSFTSSRKEAAGRPPEAETKHTTVIKAVLLSFIIVMLSLPVLYVLNIVREIIVAANSL